MTPPEFADAYDTSLPGQPFANATEADYWIAAWCARCAHSAPDRDGCELLDVAAMGRMPAAWVEVGTLPNNRYTCRLWEPAAGYLDFADAP